MKTERKFLRGTLWLLMAGSVAGLLSTVVVEESMRRRSVEVQPIVRDRHSEAGWRLEGAAVELIGVPPKAYVTHAAPGIPAQVDASVIRTDPGVLPLESVNRTIAFARLGAVGAMVLIGVGLGANRYLGRLALP